MAQATPVQMRASLEIVHGLKQSMILFVPIPVLDDEDCLELTKLLQERLDKITEEAT